MLLAQKGNDLFITEMLQIWHKPPTELLAAAVAVETKCTLYNKMNSAISQLAVETKRTLYNKMYSAHTLQ